MYKQAVNPIEYIKKIKYCVSLKFIIIFILISSFTYLNAQTSSNRIESYKPKYLNNTSQAADILGLDFINRDWISEYRPYYPCPGYYNQIPIPNVAVPEISADSSELTKDGVSILNGNVIYLDKEQKISAKKALIERNANLKKFTKLKVEGDIELLTPNMRIISKELEADLLKNQAYINSPTYFRYYPRNARGSASKVVVTKDKSYQLYNAMFTTCPPTPDNKSDWKITADEITIDPNKQIGSAKNTILYFYDFPIFYSPYLSFPTSSQRESGFLMPLYSHSDRYGHAIATPYYFNLAPNYDMTIVPRYMTKRNSQILLESRHLNQYGTNIINLEYLPNDKEFKKFKNERLASPPNYLATNNPRLTNLRHAGDDRYAIKIADSRRWSENLSTDINYSYLSDNQYYIDLPRSQVMRQQVADHLLQEAKLNYNYNNWRFEALSKGYQTLHTIDGPDLTEPYRILPSLSLENHYIVLGNLNDINSIDAPLIGSVDSHATRFASPSNPKATKLAEGQRYYIKPAISAPVKKSYGYITPKVAANIRHYDLNRLSPTAQLLGYSKQQDYFIPIYSLDSGLYFDKMYFTNKALLNHTIEPRLFYLYIPYKNQNKAPDFDSKTNTVSYEQLFRDNRFSGYDRQSDANQISLGVVSRLQNAKNGQEYLRLQLGQAYYFENKKTSRCDQNYSTNCLENEILDYKTDFSPFISQLNINFIPRLYGQAEWQWDYNLNTTRKINFGIHYNEQAVPTKSPQTIFNLEYNFLKQGNIQKDINGNKLFKTTNKRNDLSEIESSIKLPILNNWVLLGFYSYDIRNKASLDKYLGLELQKCCWALRVGYRSQLRLRTNSLADKKYDNIFTVQFSLKGLGELNQSFESILQNNIPGYQNQLSQIY